MSKQYIGGQLMYNMDFSMTPTNTGARWIDGKPIYSQVFKLASIVSGNNKMGDIPNFGTAILAFGWTGDYSSGTTGGVRWRCVPFSWQSNTWHKNLNIAYDTATSSYYLMLEQNDGQGAGNSAHAILFYTRSID